MAVEESNTVPLTITLPAAVHAELEYLTKLQKQHGAAIPWGTVEEMMQEVAVAIADGFTSTWRLGAPAFGHDRPDTGM
ncbi:hypothetical protein SAMN05878442_3656 [Vreelandella aquamarina]|uniref:hypothetical protein n=1 Tax=Vreelandella aquamarina TaxID=77097 RepID=UPI0009279192|nr:hypothetical protein [Halomonas meridiana]SIO50454.1 hypothetical protein SAMN05878442_3656 [Halomonas meridiana]